MYTDLFSSKAVLRSSCENPDPSTSFRAVLCSTFFAVSKWLCNLNNTSVREILKPDVLMKIADDREWDVCSSAVLLGYSYADVFGFIARDQTQCKQFCADDGPLAPVCRWLVAAAKKYSEATSVADSTKKTGQETGENKLPGTDATKDKETPAAESKMPTDAAKDEGTVASGNSTSHTGAGVRTDAGSQENANRGAKVPDYGSMRSGSNILAGTDGDAASQPKNTQLTPQIHLNATGPGAQQLITNTTGVAPKPVLLPDKTVQGVGNVDEPGHSENGGNAGDNPGANAAVGSSSPAGESQVNKTTMEETSALKTGSQSLTNDVSKAANPSAIGNGTQQSGVAATTKLEDKPPAQNINIVTSPPASANTTQQPRVPETANPKGNPPPGVGPLGSSPPHDSAMTSLPTTTKMAQQQEGVDAGMKDNQDQENTFGRTGGNQVNQIPASKDSQLPPSKDNQIPLYQDSQLPASKNNQNSPSKDSEIQFPPPANGEEEQKFPSSFQAGMPGNVYKAPENDLQEDEPPSGHFMAYFVTAVVLCVAGYVIYHNKQKIFAFVLEGRRDAQQRRRASGGNGNGSSSAKYHKLETSVEEVMPSLEKSTTSTNYIY